MLLFIAAALAADPTVTVHVVDAKGAPVANAAVFAPQSPTTHCVDPAGRWTGDHLEAQDGSPVAMSAGANLKVSVYAPGFAPVTVDYPVRPADNVVEVRLAPQDLDGWRLVAPSSTTPAPVCGH